MQIKVLVMYDLRILGSNLIQNKRTLNQNLCTPISLMDTHMMIILHKNFGLKKPLEELTKKGPKKIWVPKDKIVYLADILSSQIETPILVPGL